MNKMFVCKLVVFSRPPVLEASRNLSQMRVMLRKERERERKKGRRRRMPLI